MMIKGSGPMVPDPFLDGDLRLQVFLLLKWMNSLPPCSLLLYSHIQQ